MNIYRRRTRNGCLAGSAAHHWISRDLASLRRLSAGCELAGADGNRPLSWSTRSLGLSGAIILTIAGLYQFSSLKYACLEKCRSPLSFLTSRWQGGNESVQALRIGVEHGLFCVGCCWSLMLLMFVVGTGSLAWMLLLGVVMALEKNFSWGRRLSAPLGVLLFVGAVAVFVDGIRS